MKRTMVLGVLLAIGAFAAAKAQQPTADAPKVVEVEKVKDNLYVLRGGGGNTAVFITATGVVVVDAKNPGWGQPILNKIKELTPKPITTLINTHTHGDHVSGNVEFPASVEVIAQENTKANMEKMPIFKEHNNAGMAKKTFKDKMTIGKGADQIDLYYFGRAHTGGDAYVVFRALRVMHVGDTMPTRDMPIMDKNNGGSAVEFSATVAKAAAAATANSIDTIINGHNPTTTTPADLKLYSEFIADFVKFVQDAKKSGKTVDDVVSGWKVPAKYTGYATPAAARVKADAQVVFDETR